MTKQNKINISELLKNCPSRMELNCTMYEDVYFDYVDELNIIHCYIQHETHKTSLTFNQHGTPNSDIKSKCVIFPKGKTTWEGFKPSYKFKVGDKVYNIVHNENQIITKLFWDSQENEFVYQTNNNEYVYANYLQPYKEETMEEGDKAMAPTLVGEDYSRKRFGYKIPQGYEFDCIQNNEIIIKPIKPQYPKTYDECCDMLNADEFVGYELMTNFPKLINARNAYWKIAGEQMGLGKPWKPDYTNLINLKYCIINNGFHIEVFNSYTPTNKILIFPTAEMRDIFYENFKEEIEMCKELL